MDPQNILQFSELYEQRYRALLTANSHLIWITDLEGRMKEESAAWCKATGQSWEECKGWGWTNVFHAEDRRNILAAWKQEPEEKIFEMEARLRCAEGEFRWFRIQSLPVLKGENLSERAFTAHDIDEYKTLEMLLKEKNSVIKEMMGQIEVEKKIFSGKIQRNVDKVLLPLLKKLKAKATTIETEYMELLESNLMELAGSSSGLPGSALKDLTPKEIEICNLIRNGLMTKEIARLLKISVLTVSTHRTNIRKKLKLSKRKANLTAFLQNTPY